MNLVLLIVWLIFSSHNGSTTGTSSQISTPPDLLNDYVDLTNESIHGLLIIHRLLENYNQKLNKQITGGKPINLYKNSDLPEDIFEDPDEWFFLKNPYKIYSHIEKHASQHPEDQTSQLLPIAKRMLQICKAINKSRFDIEQYLQTNDMLDTLNQQLIFNKLEKCVDMYDDFFESSAGLESRIRDIYQSPDYAKRRYFSKLSDAHQLIKQVLRQLRSKDDSQIENYLQQLKIKIKEIEISNDKTGPLRGSLGTIHSNIIEKIIEAHDKAYLEITTGVIAPEYKLYDKYYYYHNSQIINKMNRYGNGYVREINLLIDQLSAPELKFFEEPHYFQVAYPEDESEKETIKSTTDHISDLPEQLLDRSVSSSERLIYVDSLTFTINLYDHKLTDGDIVSINYNGDWILKNYSLEEKPAQLTITLNENGKNFLLLHAESIGRRPPNTMGISYYFKGEKQEIVLKSDLSESEMIEIEYISPDMK